jgi:hypothetical protein
MDELRFLVMVRKESGNIYDSDKYETENMSIEDMVEAFKLFVEDHYNDERG